MFEEEEALKPAKEQPVSRNLEGLDVDDLQDYIAFLQGEITRTEAEITKRGDVKSAADAFFK